MKLVILTLIASLALFGCLQSGPTYNNNTIINPPAENGDNQGIAPGEPNPNIPNQSTTPIEDAAMNVYAKDAEGSITSMRLTISQVTAIDEDENSVILYSGSQYVTLDNLTTSRIASKRIAPGTYSEIRITIAQDIQLTTKQGTTVRATAVNGSEITVPIFEMINGDETLNIIIDIPLNETINQTTPGNYIFNSSQGITYMTQTQAGIYTGPLGLINSDLEIQLGIIRPTAVTGQASANITVNTTENLPSNATINVTANTSNPSSNITSNIIVNTTNVTGDLSGDMIENTTSNNASANTTANTSGAYD